MLSHIISAIVAFFAGFIVNSFGMKVSFKRRTIDNKIKIYGELIAQWVKMRNFVYYNHPGPQGGDLSWEILRQWDVMYGESHQYIGEAALTCENGNLIDKINHLNNKMHFTKWHELQIEQVNEVVEQFKTEAMSLISEMRRDVMNSTRLEWKDLKHIFSGLWPWKKS